MFNIAPFNTIFYNRRGAPPRRVHIIIEAEYSAASPQLNRSYVIGQDLSGSAVTGEAVMSGEAALVGERLDVQHAPEATSAAVAGYVAASVLAKARLGTKKAKITITPHCGLELWDVVNIYDEYGNQAANYRVASYAFEYSILDSKWYHAIELCAP